MCNATCLVEKALGPWLSSFYVLIKKVMFFPQGISRLRRGTAGACSRFG